MSNNWERTIVMDNGSGVCKCGFAGDDLPNVIFPSVVGEPKLADEDKSTYVGESVAPLQGALKVRYPLANGKVERWDDMRLIWDHAYSLLDVEPSHHPILLTEAPLNPHKNRERMTEIMFETYRVPALYIAIQAVLALYASGRTTGIVVDSGDGVTHTVPVYEGYAIPHAIERMNLAGRDLTEYLQRLLLLRGYSFTTSAEFELVKLIKEKLCFVKPNRSENPPRNAALKGRYELPGGDVVRIFEERYLCPEALFSPNLIGKESPGIHEIINRSINASDIDLRKGLFISIIFHNISYYFYFQCLINY